MSVRPTIARFGVKFRTPGSSDPANMEVHVQNIKMAAFVKAAGIAAAVPAIVMIVGAGRKF